MTDPMTDELACRDVVEVVTDYLEDGLPPDERLALELHLGGCDGCEAYVEQLRAVIRVAGRPIVDVVPRETMAELLRAFRDWRH